MGDPAAPENIALDSFAEELYARLEPLQYSEEEYSYALQKFCAALGLPFQEVEDLARDQVVESQQLNPMVSPPTVHPGWSVLLDVDRIPDKGLGWLGQFVGVPLDPKLGSVAQRERIRSAEGWHRGQPASFIAAAYQYLNTYPSYRKHIIVDNPIAYWRLGPSQFILDSSYNNVTGDLLGGSLGTEDSIIENPYDNDKATLFNGNYGANFTQDVLSRAGVTPMSIEAWTKLSFPNPGTPQSIIQRGSAAGGQQGYQLGIVDVAGVDRLTFQRFLNGAVDTLNYDGGINLNVVHHIVATYDGTSMRLYVDGKIVSGPTASSKSLLAELGQTLYIGANLEANTISGIMDEIAMYNYALSPERIEAHNSAGRGHPVDPHTQGNVYLRERYLGNAAKLDIVISRMEADDLAAITAALQEIKPAGITMTVTVAPWQTFNQVRLNNASFTAVKAAYANFQVMRDTIAI